LKEKIEGDNFPEHSYVRPRSIIQECENEGSRPMIYSPELEMGNNLRTNKTNKV